MFEHCRTTTDQGNIGEAYAILYYTKNRYVVSKPLTMNQAYDLVVDYYGKLERVSVKTTQFKGPSGSYVVGLRTLGGNQSFGTVKKFDRRDVERLFILCSDGSMYDIPTDQFINQSSITLGVEYNRFKVAHDHR